MKDGITKWIGNWKKNGWRTAAKKPVKNADLWRRLDRVVWLSTKSVGTGLRGIMAILRTRGSMIWLGFRR